MSYWSLSPEGIALDLGPEGLAKREEVEDFFREFAMTLSGAMPDEMVLEIEDALEIGDGAALEQAGVDASILGDLGEMDRARANLVVHLSALCQVQLVDANPNVAHWVEEDEAGPFVLDHSASRDVLVDTVQSVVQALSMVLGEDDAPGDEAGA